MKPISYRYLLYTLLLFVSLASCRSDDTNGPSVQDLTFEKLAGNWTFGTSGTSGTSGSITLDGQDITLNYPDFALSFADGTYNTTNAGDLFRASGTWRWTGEEATSVLLDTGEEVTIIDLTRIIHLAKKSVRIALSIGGICLWGCFQQELMIWRYNNLDFTHKILGKLI